MAEIFHFHYTESNITILKSVAIFERIAIFTLNIWTDMSEQIDQDEMASNKQFVQSLCCLPFIQHILDNLSGS